MTVAFEVKPRTGDMAFLVLECEHSKAGQCMFSLWQRPAVYPMWQWDGNVDQPTITPSINCHGGCGRHFTMVRGEAN